MKRCMLAASILIFISFSLAMSSGVETASVKIVGELKKEYSKRVSQDVVLADFITLNAPGSAFGAYLKGTLTDAFRRDPGVTILDQQKVDAVLEANDLRFNDGVEFSALEGLSQAIFEATHDTPTAICFGRIEEWGVDDIRITVKMIDAMTGDPIAASIVTFPGDGTTDRLLGKPVRERMPAKTDTVVLIKERTVEQQPGSALAVKPAEGGDRSASDVAMRSAAAREFSVQGFTVALKQCYFSGDVLQFDFTVVNTNDLTKEFMLDRGRLVEANGNEVRSERTYIGGTRGGTYLRTDMIANAPLTVSMQFEGVSPKLQSIKALQLTVLGREFILRDIPIELK